MTNTTTTETQNAGTAAGGQATMMFVNLPVKDLQASIDFFTALGFTFDAQFTDETATAMVINDTCSVMLLTEPKFRQFTTKQLAHTSSHTEAIFALSASSRAGVDELVDTALQAGGRPSNETMDEGGMYGRSFQDLDGHLWEVMWMDPSVMGA